MRSHGNNDINVLLAHLEGKLHGPLDGREVDNRRACWSLLRKIHKENDGRRQQAQRSFDAVASIVALIDTIFSGHPSMTYHERRCTSFRYLLYHARAIVNDYRAARAKEPAGKMEELGRRFADEGR